MAELEDTTTEDGDATISEVGDDTACACAICLGTLRDAVALPSCRRALFAVSAAGGSSHPIPSP